jgi:hypothetical protein
MPAETTPGQSTADRAEDVFDEVLQQLAVPAYEAHRYGESGTQVLAEELRPLPWREARD